MADRQDILSKLESRWALARELGAVPVIGAIAGGAFARFSDFMAAGAPYSWFAGAVVGALGFQLVSMAAAARGEFSERRRRIAMLAAPKSQINPLQHDFHNQRIYINDLLPPRGFLIAGKVFRDCDFIGPQNIVLLSSEFLGCEIHDSDGIIVDDDSNPTNIIAFKDCSIRNCRFYSVTIVMPATAYEKYRDPLGQVNWLNIDIYSKGANRQPQSPPDTPS